MSCLIFLVEKVHGASPKEDHPDLGSHWVLSSFLAFWTTGDSLFPGGFLLMALVQIVPIMFRHMHLFLLRVFNLVAWLTPQSPKPGTQRPPGMPLLSFCSCCSPTLVAVLKVPLGPGPGPTIVQALRTPCLGS